MAHFSQRDFIRLTQILQHKASEFLYFVDYQIANHKKP